MRIKLLAFILLLLASPVFAAYDPLPAGTTSAPDFNFRLIDEEMGNKADTRNHVVFASSTETTGDAVFDGDVTFNGDVSFTRAIVRSSTQTVFSAYVSPVGTSFSCNASTITMTLTVGSTVSVRLTGTSWYTNFTRVGYILFLVDGDVIPPNTASYPNAELVDVNGAAITRVPLNVYAEKYLAAGAHNFCFGLWTTDGNGGIIPPVRFTVRALL